MVLNQLHTTFGKGLHLGDCRKAQNTGDVTGCFPFRIDVKGKSHLLLHKAELTLILDAAHPCDGILCPQFFGGHAGKDIDLIFAGSGNDQIRLPRTRLLLSGIGGAVALDAQNVQLVCQSLRHSRTIIDCSNIMSLSGEMLRQCTPNLSYSDNHNPHNNLLLPCSIG